MFVGRKDAWALMGVGAGLAAASPWFSGNPYALPALLGPAVRSAWFAHQQSLKWLDRTDTQSRENFILRSDENFGEFMHRQQGLRLGYTQDEALPLDIEDGYLQRHTAIIVQSGVGNTTLSEY